jgi:uncharacterized protein YegP (UPF0339 family)
MFQPFVKGLFMEYKNKSLSDNFGLLGGLGGLVSYANKTPHFEVYADDKAPINKFRWHIKMSSDIVASSSQGYATRELSLQNAKQVLSHLIYLNENNKLV